MGKRLPEGGIMSDIYYSWEKVPKELHTKTTLKKMGLVLKEGVEPVAHKVGERKRKYALYGLDQTEKREVDPAKQERGKRLAAGSLAKRTCKGCGLIQAPRPRRGTRVINGYCDYCQETAAEYENWLEVVNRSHAILQNDLSKVLILDTETNGLGGRVLELAILDGYGNERYNQRFAFNHLEAWSEAAEAIHGIGIYDLDNCPDFAHEWPTIAAILGQATVVGIYNKDYDITALWRMCTTLGLEFDPAALPFHCLMVDYAVFCGEKRRSGQYKWQPLNGDHTAAGDCEKALFLLRMMGKAWGGDEYQHRLNLVKGVRGE